MLKEIVAHPSLLGHEASVQEYMESMFKQLQKTDPRLEVRKQPINRKDIETKQGYSPAGWGYHDEDTVTGKNKGKVSVIASRKPHQKQGKSIVFNGHVDVVPTGPEGKPPTLRFI